MKKMLCLAVFALGLATPAVAADWVLLGIGMTIISHWVMQTAVRTIEHGLKKGMPRRKTLAMENFIIQLNRWKKWIAVVDVVGL